jgi:hypothetical protein
MDFQLAVSSDGNRVDLAASLEGNSMEQKIHYTIASSDCSNWQKIQQVSWANEGIDMIDQEQYVASL